MGGLNEAYSVLSLGMIVSFLPLLVHGYSVHCTDVLNFKKSTSGAKWDISCFQWSNIFNSMHNLVELPCCSRHMILT